MDSHSGVYWQSGTLGAHYTASMCVITQDDYIACVIGGHLKLLNVDNYL